MNPILHFAAGVIVLASVNQALAEDTRVGLLNNNSEATVTLEPLPEFGFGNGTLTIQEVGPTGASKGQAVAVAVGESRKIDKGTYRLTIGFKNGQSLRHFTILATEKGPAGGPSKETKFGFHAKKVDKKIEFGSIAKIKAADSSLNLVLQKSMEALSLGPTE